MGSYTIDVITINPSSQFKVDSMPDFLRYHACFFLAKRECR
uniref:Uncharacterized protein n=1 Tax=Rhizophora mucronata TaxID=61149 RepID=A0A2P2P6L3_RHIMU